MFHAHAQADTQKIKIFDLRTGSRREISSSWDASVEEICWAPDGKRLFCTAQCRGRKQVYSIALDDASAGTKAEPETLVAEHTSSGLCLIGGRRLVFSQSSMCAPAEVFTCLTDGSALCALSVTNAPQLNKVVMGTVNEMVCNGAKNEPVQSWLIYPAGFDSKLVYPMVVIVHGGPQGAILDSFGYRWNPQIYAGAGFVVLCVNFHGTRNRRLFIANFTSCSRRLRYVCQHPVSRSWNVTPVWLSRLNWFWLRLLPLNFKGLGGCTI